MEYLFIKSERGTQESIDVLRFLTKNIAQLNKKGIFISTYKITKGMIDDTDTMTELRNRGISTFPTITYKGGHVEGVANIIDRYQKILTYKPKIREEPDMEKFMNDAVLMDDGDDSRPTRDSDSGIKLDDLSKRMAKYGTPNEIKKEPKRFKTPQAIRESSDESFTMDKMNDDNDDDIFRRYANSDS